MNREIKFRIWDSVHNKIIYLKDMVSFEYDNGFDVYELYFEENNLKCRGYDDFDDDFGGAIVNETDLPIMEYTGLKDKNGVEVYEGDLIEYKDSTGKHIEEVKFDKGCFYVGLHGGSSTRVAPKLINTRISKVIGNIYENEVE